MNDFTKQLNDNQELKNSIKDWYKATYPSDDIFEKFNDNITFQDLKKE